MTCTCGHTSDEHGGADNAVSYRIVAGRCALCACEAYTEPGSMRVMYARKCTGCQHEWKAPSPTGACPQCHEAKTVTLGMQNNGLKRV
jgi:hypothetical protein